MGSKRPRPWGRQPSGNSSSVAVAAATFALAALSIKEASGFSGSCTGRSDSSRTRRWGDNRDGTTCIADSQDGPARRRKALVLNSSGGSGAYRAPPSSRRSGQVRSVPPPSPPAVLPLADDDEDSNGGGNSRESFRRRDSSVSPSISAVSVVRVLEPQPRRPTRRPRGSAPTRPAAASSSTRATNRENKGKAVGEVHRWNRDNDARMFLMERGLSQWEVRKVLPVLRRDPELVNDVATLAARMQAIADLLEAAVSWYSPEGEAAAGVPQGKAVATTVDAVNVERAAPRAGTGGTPLPSVSISASTELRSEDARSWDRMPNGQDDDGRANRRTAPAPASAMCVTRGGGGGGGGNSSQGKEAVAEGTAWVRLYGGGADGDRHRKREGHHAVPPSTGAASAGDAVWAGANRAEGEGARLHAYQLVASEPRLLLLRAEPDLALRLRFLLEMLPGLRRGYWNGRLRRAAPLLAVDTATLQGRLESLVEMFPAHVDVQAVLNQAPLLLRHSTETVAAALANAERLIPGLRVDRVLRSAPLVLVQPLDVVERRLSHLRRVLGLTPSPEFEKMRIAVGPKTSNSDCGAERATGGRGGGRAAGVRTLARFANAFPQILTMEPHTVRAKIEGLEELLPGMDGLAVVSSRPRLLGFSVRRNVSLKVSGLRALMKRQEAKPEQSRREHQHQQASATATGNDLAAVVTRCPSLLTLSSETAARKVEELQQALPQGLDARAVVAKEPRVLALDMGSTVPQKLDSLTRALAAHAARGGDGEEAVAAAAAQVLRYYPNALRLDPSTLASKLEALREAGLSSATVLLVVGGAPRCLSAAARTLEQRVSTLKGAFPSICVDGMLGKAPGLLQNKIDPGARVKVLQELFPSLNPLGLVEGAPMLLALSESTLRAKSEAWRNVLEARVEQPWEQTIAEFPQLLCQGLGRAARVAFLLLPDDSSAAAAVHASLAPSAPASDEGDTVVAAAGVAAIAVGTKMMSAATAYREVCRRVADFESDHPSYPAFLDSLLLAARCQPAGGDRVVRGLEGSSPNPSAMERGVLLGGDAPNRADLEALPGNQRQLDQRHTGPRAPTAIAAGTQAGGGVFNRHTGMEAPVLSANNGQQQQQPLPGAGAPLASPVPLSTPVGETRMAVTSEKALGAAMTVAAKGPRGGRGAAAMLLLEDVGVQRDGEI